MSKDLFHISLCRETLNLPSLPDSDKFGSHIAFSGIVRGSESGNPIAGIYYSAYESMAEGVMTEIAGEAQKRFCGHGLWLEHRIGFVPAGEPSLHLIVTTAHSAEGYEISRWYLEQVKTRLPIWKEPRFCEAATTVG